MTSPITSRLLPRARAAARRPRSRFHNATRVANAMRVALMAVALAVSSATGAAAQSSAGDSALAPLLGAYRFGSSHDVVVSTLRIGPRVSLLLADLQSDALRVLFPGERADLYTAGAALARPAPAEQRIRFVRQHGVVVAAERQWLDAGRVMRSDTARRIPFRQRSSGFANGDVLLQGTLYVPATPGPHPAVVLAHGSEESDRDSFGPIPFALVSRGFAVLVYDKRGTGRSTGSWRTVGLEPLAQDVAAGIVWLRKQPGIDPRRVGIYGTSEGGWVAAAASARVPGVAFVVTASGGARTKADAYLHKVRRQLEGTPLSPSARDSAVRATVAFLDSSRGRAAHADAAGFDRRLAYDPTDHWMRVTAPVLHLEGEFDVLQSGPSAAAWYEALHRRAGHADATVKLFPKAHHSLVQGASGSAAEFESAEGLTQMATGYWDVLLGWLAGHAHR